MNILADENIPGRAIIELRNLRHQVTDVRETQSKGADDAQL